MSGLVCLQGGAEFGPACREMDALVLARAAGGPVVVSALAGKRGGDYRTATDNGVRHYRALGADAVAAPDAREEPDLAADVLAGAALIVLPGGSPSRLRAALTGTPAGRAVTDLLARGGVVSGASAGAMLLCAWTLLPEEPGPGGPLLAAGLGAVPGALVLPHFDADRPGAWPAAARAQLPAEEGVTLLGLPECAGVLVQDGVLTAAGAAPTTLLRPDGRPETLEAGATAPLRTPAEATPDEETR